MSDTIHVPLTGTNVTREDDDRGPTMPPRDGDIRPAYTKHERSIHRVRGLGRAIAPKAETEEVAEWQERGGHGQFRFRERPIQRQPEPDRTPPQPSATDGMQQQLNILTLGLARQMGIQTDTGPQMPNPAAYDFYDPQQEGEYHQALQEYVEAEKQKALQPHQAAIAQAEFERQFDAVSAEHNASPQLQRAALEMLADSGGKLTIPEAFAAASDPNNAKPGQRGNMHLPAQLKKGKFPRLGSIMAHNQMSGRARGR